MKSRIAAVVAPERPLPGRRVMLDISENDKNKQMKRLEGKAYVCNYIYNWWTTIWH